MSAMWGIHNDHPDMHIEDLGVVTIGWDEVGDLKVIGPDREALKAKVGAENPAAKKGAIPVWAGVLYRFAFEIQVGDIVIYPYKPARTLFFGRITGDYYFDTSVSEHRNRRTVDWFLRDVPRATFSQNALFEIGSAVTVFRVKTHAPEFEKFISEGGVPTRDAEAFTTQEPDAAATQAEEQISAGRIDENTRDFVLKRLLHSLSAYEFEQFVASLLETMGYQAQVTPPSGDGGVDVIASRDPLGLGPPVIKVQCKRTVATMGAPDVQKLCGTLAGQQQGLFVTLGTYSPQAEHEARSREGVRLVNGSDVVDLVLENYESLDDRWKRALPLRRVYAVDDEPGGGGG